MRRKCSGEGIGPLSCPDKSSLSAGADASKTMAPFMSNPDVVSFHMKQVEEKDSNRGHKAMHD